MIKIYELRTKYIDFEALEHVRKEQLESEEVGYLVRKNGNIIGYASAEDIYHNNISDKFFTFSLDLFIRVRDYVAENSISDKTFFPVLDPNGRFLFWVIYLENMIIGSKRNDFLDYEKRFLKLSDLDFTLLDQYHSFVFVETNEYSVAIAKMIKKHYSDKKVIFLDKWVNLFVNKGEIKYFPFHGYMKNGRTLLRKWICGSNINFMQRVIAFILYQFLKLVSNGESCCFIDDNNKDFPELNNIYSSLEMMYSLLWLKKKREYGVKNPEKYIFLLDYACFNEGLVSIMKCTFSHIMWILEKGFIPAVNLHTRPNQYLNDESENMWEYFFEPVSEVTLKEAYESKNVISALDNDIVIAEWLINPYQKKAKRLFEEADKFNATVKLNEQTEKYIITKMPYEINNNENRVLGVVMRGTDFRREAAVKQKKAWREKMVSIDKFMEACKFYKEQLKCDYIFLATEDAEYFDIFKKSFGDKLLSIFQKRVYYNYEINEYKPVKDLLKNEDGKEAGRNYLAIIKSLAECNALVFNVECGAAQLAQRWNCGKYELVKCVHEDWNMK